MTDKNNDEYLTDCSRVKKNSIVGKYITKTADCIYRGIYFDSKRKYPKEGKKNVIKMILTQLMGVYHRGKLDG